MRALLLSILFIFGAGEVLAETIDCGARVALNRYYTVSLDTESGAVSIATDNGYEYSGFANKSVSGRTGNTMFFLGLSYEDAIEIELENGGRNRIAMCLEANECYLCTRL